MSKLFEHGSIRTNQRTIHPKLRRLIRRYRTSIYRRPFPRFSQEVCRTLEQILEQTTPSVLIIDAGCGTGQSTILLARRFPAATVIGIDKSAVKLDRNVEYRRRQQPPNCFLLRGNLIDVWRWLAQHRITVHYHFLWYPNPWPKSRHLQRRWYAHPVFPLLFEFSHFLELRTNWFLYAAEFALALEELTGQSSMVERFTPAVPVTPFEHKYSARAESLYRVRWYRILSTNRAYRTANGYGDRTL